MRRRNRKFLELASEKPYMDLKSLPDGLSMNIEQHQVPSQIDSGFKQEILDLLLKDFESGLKVKRPSPPKLN